MVVTLLAFSSSGRSLVLDSERSGPFVIGLTQTTTQTGDESGSVSEPYAKRSDVIARTVLELFPNYIQRIFERSFNRAIIVETVDPVDHRPTADASGKDIPSIVITPKIISMGDLGVRVSAQVVGYDRGTSSAIFHFEEVLLLPPNSDYGELDTKLADLSASIARRIVTTEASTPTQDKSGQPRGVARFYCVAASEPQNRPLQQLSVLLTLELPFHLNAAARAQGLNVAISGLSVKEMLSVCAPGGAHSAAAQNLSDRVENFSWDGTLSPDREDENARNLVIRVSDVLSNSNYRRLKSIKVHEGSSPELKEIAEQIIKDFAELFSVR